MNSVGCEGEIRGLSTVLGYTLTLAISTLLVTGLIVAGGDFVTTQRELVIENELEVIGEQAAGQLQQADRLVTASPSGPAEVSISRSVPQQAVGSTYDISLEENGGTGPDRLILDTTNPDITVTIDVSLKNDVGETTATGGTLVAEWCTSCSPNQLVINNG